MKVVEKVTAFVTRETADGRQLLVFRHPLNGIQLPAGTVDVGESPETAVLREAWEETGLDGLRLVRPLGMIERHLPDNHHLLQGDSQLFTAPAPDAAPISNWILYRGGYARLLQEQGDYAEILFQEWNQRVEPPQIVRQEQGWLRRELLTPTFTGINTGWPATSRRRKIGRRPLTAISSTCSGRPCNPRPILSGRRMNGWRPWASF
jgi:8-oxo-dGTP pyrophosphatase MutT (NUDIX family)